MNGFANIKFDGNLIQNKPCKITYSGLFFQNNSDSVIIVYGFEDDWKESSEKEMQKTENGFVAEITMPEYSSFNFCFRNSNYEWDNNNYQNYGAPITKENIREITNEIDANVIGDEVDSSFKNAESELTDLNGLGVENIVSDESDYDLTSFEASVEKNDPLNIEDTLVSSVEESVLNQEIENIFGYETASNKQELLDDILSNNSNNFSMNSLIDEILSPIVSSSVFDEEPTAVHTENAQETQTESDEEINGLIEDLISNIYKNVDSDADATTASNVENTSTAVETTTVENAQESDSVIDEVIEESIVESFIENGIDTDEPEAAEEISQVKIVKDVPTSQVAQQEEKSLVVSPRSLSKFYLIKKKIKIALYKLLRLFPKETSTSSDKD